MRSLIWPRTGIGLPVSDRATFAAAWGICLALAFAASAVTRAAAPEDGTPLTIVVMDPLARQLSCNCVEGYAQRDYDLLALYLEKKLRRSVKLSYAESLAEGLRAAQSRPVHLIIGKRSLVEADAAECKLKARPLAMLTDRNGLTTLTGLFVVSAGDPAQKIGDLHGYRIVLGPPESAEKHAAALASLKKASVPIPPSPETAPSCMEAAFAVLENQQSPGAAAVISSYAIALLEGCGSVERGALRVIGQTEPVPFITVFATPSVNAETQRQITSALLDVAKIPQLLTAMESQLGFVAVVPKAEDDVDTDLTRSDRQATVASAGADKDMDEWPQWRGPKRDAISPWLPLKLPERPNILWRKATTGAALSGIAVVGRHVIVADRDPLDQHDIFRCLDAESGKQHWQFEYLAPGDLDYGNSPRATPLIHGGLVYLLGAFGDLHCVEIDSGRLRWRKQLVEEFNATLPTWGMCASPLIVDNKLIVNPGARQASLVALDPLTGEVVWRSAGLPAAYSSFIVGRFGGRRQIVGYDAISLGGWDVATGKRLWSLIPPQDGDFNVPTPIDVGGRLLVATENNGTRLYDFDEQGKIIQRPVALYEDLAPDSSTPVVANDRIFGCFQRLMCLDVSSGLHAIWSAEDEAFEDYVSIIGGPKRILITSSRGELLLVSTEGNRYQLISRMAVFDDDSEVLSHPALAGKRLYIRSTTAVCCVSLQ